MAPRITFGWRISDFPEYGAQAPAFREDIFRYMDVLQAGGLDSAWAGDHFFPWPEAIDQSLDTIEAWTTLTFLMARYTTMRFGTIVLSQSYRSPAALAKMAAAAHWLSGGRFILGLGAGWKQNEYQAYGYDFPPNKVRLDQLEEAVRIIRCMWTEDAPSYQGQYYRIENAFCNPRPTPPPPLLIGGAGPLRTLRIVAKYADWCNLNNVDPEKCRASLEILRGHCQKVGRNYDSILKTFSSDCIAIAPTRAAAEQIWKASFYKSYAPIVGSPDEVAARIQEYANEGIRHFILRFADFPRTDGAALFMQEVMPRFS
jgi:alkanesulfonate monooxygenase SsuD/methylene tetrahydromethanopterin reductase-like flavin-dependent oxidoreductase (luciferase family)